METPAKSLISRDRRRYTLTAPDAFHKVYGRRDSRIDWRAETPACPMGKARSDIARQKGAVSATFGVVIKGQHGDFEIKVRQCVDYPLDFSVIVAFKRRNENTWFHLRRYNGKHPSTHFNRLPSGAREPVVGFHIHQATADAQRRGRDEEAHAVPTSAYSDVYSAIEYALSDCNFDKPKTVPESHEGQMDLDFEHGDG